MLSGLRKLLSTLVRYLCVGTPKYTPTHRQFILSFPLYKNPMDTTSMMKSFAYTINLKSYLPFLLMQKISK